MEERRRQPELDEKRLAEAARAIYARYAPKPQNPGEEEVEVELVEG